MADSEDRVPSRRSRRLAGLDPSAGEEGRARNRPGSSGGVRPRTRRTRENRETRRRVAAALRRDTRRSGTSAAPPAATPGGAITFQPSAGPSGVRRPWGETQPPSSSSTSSTSSGSSTSSTPDSEVGMAPGGPSTLGPGPGVGSGRDRRRRRRLGTNRHRGPSLRTYTEQLGAVPVRGESFCECAHQTQSRDLQCRCGEEDSVFEWSWDKGTKSDASDLSDNWRDVRFHVNYSSGTAAVRGNQCLTDRQYFWEIKMTTPVYGTDMMVGVGTEAVDLDSYKYSFCSFLGRDSDSWGLSYYGRAQHKGNFHPLTGARFGQGSIIGCHLDMWHGTLSFYKNRRPLGTAYTGLAGKKVFPMVCSTAARTGMRLIKASSFQTSLQFMCCQLLRSLVPSHLDVMDALNFPPGMQAFLTNNLSWLLRPNEVSLDVRYTRTPGRKRRRACSEDEEDAAAPSTSKQTRGLWARLQESDDSSDEESDTTTES